MAPLFVVSGASGTGKSTVCQLLTTHFREAVLLGSDILWRGEFNTPETKYRDYFETWLRMCKNIAQSGRPVVLFGAGHGVPENLEDCIERRYISEIHYLALVCSADIIADRLMRRPAWRETRDPEFMQRQQRFNQWFIDYHAAVFQPPITTLDTTNVHPEDTARDVTTWISEHLNREAVER